MKIPKKLSAGEEMLAFHLTAARIDFRREVCLVPGRKWRWDFYLRQKNLAIEIQGQTWTKGAHSSGTGLLRDYRKHNALTLAGCKCLYFTTDQVKSGEAIDTVIAYLNRPSSLDARR